MARHAAGGRGAQPSHEGMRRPGPWPAAAPLPPPPHPGPDRPGPDPGTVNGVVPAVRDPTYMVCSVYCPRPVARVGAVAPVLTRRPTVPTL